MKNLNCRLACTMSALALTASQSLAQSIYEPYNFTTLAGLAGSGGNADGTGSAARFGLPDGIAVDSAGNVYVADTSNHIIRKVTPAGVVTTLAGLAGSAGSADGAGSAARFSEPHGVAVDSVGNVYVADSRNYTIRKVTAAGVVSTLAGSADSYWLGVAADSMGNVYVANSDGIRKVTPSGAVTTLAGVYGNCESADGTGSTARFNGPYGVALDSAGNVYVADTGTIRKVTPTGVVTKLAGLAGSRGSEDGMGINARFGAFGGEGTPGPAGVAVDSAGNVYVTDTWNNTIRKGYPAPRILTSDPGFGFTGGQFGFNLTGPAGRPVVVEASTDLVSWRPFWTNTFTFPAALNFSDPQSGVSSTRFYRAVMP